MLTEAGLKVTDRLYIRRSVTETEIDIDGSVLDDEVIRSATERADSDVYQFVWSVVPADQLPPTLGAEALWHELEVAKASAGRLKADRARQVEVAELAEAQVAELTARVDALCALLRTSREKAADLRQKLDKAERATRPRLWRTATDVRRLWRRR